MKASILQRNHIACEILIKKYTTPGSAAPFEYSHIWQKELWETYDGDINSLSNANNDAISIEALLKDYCNGNFDGLNEFEEKITRADSYQALKGRRRSGRLAETERIGKTTG